MQHPGDRIARGQPIDLFSRAHPCQLILTPAVIAHTAERQATLFGLLILHGADKFERLPLAKASAN